MAEDTIKIGVLATFEGAFAVLGEDSMRGAMLALKEHGGMAGGKKIEIVKGSSDASPDSAVRAARKLVEQDGVKIMVGPLSGDEGLAVKDYAKTQPDVTFINGTSAAQDTTLRDPAPNFFRFSTDGAQWMAGLGDYASTTKGYKKVVDRRRGLFLPLHAGVRLHGRVLQGRRPRGRRSSGCRSAPRTSPRSSPRSPTTSTRSMSRSAAPTRVNFLTQYEQAGGTAPLIGGSITVDQTVLGSKGKQPRLSCIGTPSAGPIADN